MNYHDIDLPEAYTWESMIATQCRFLSTFEYRWVNGKIVHPMRYSASRSLRAMANIGWALIAQKYAITARG